MHIYILEFCGALGFKNRKNNNYAKVKILDDRNRISGEFVVSRLVIPKETQPGDELEFMNKTRRVQS